ncbi:MAG: hypothetical protein RR186_02055 [Raoultibacter sp.]
MQNRKKVQMNLHSKASKIATDLFREVEVSQKEVASIKEKQKQAIKDKNENKLGAQGYVDKCSAYAKEIAAVRDRFIITSQEAMNEFKKYADDSLAFHPEKITEKDKMTFSGMVALNLHDMEKCWNEYQFLSMYDQMRMLIKYANDNGFKATEPFAAYREAMERGIDQVAEYGVARILDDPSRLFNNAVRISSESGHRNPEPVEGYDSLLLQVLAGMADADDKARSFAIVEA